MPDATRRTPSLARRGHAFVGSQKSACRADEHPDHSRVRKLRELLAAHKDLARKIEKLEVTQKDHAALLSIVIKDIENLGQHVTREFKKLKSPPLLVKISDRLPRPQPGREVDPSILGVLSEKCDGGRTADCLRVHIDRRLRFV